MKKVIALALALGMALSMTAMAAVIEVIPANPEGTDCGDSVGTDDRLYPGNEYHYGVGLQTLYTTNNDAQKNTAHLVSIDTDFFRVSTDWSVGSAMVSSVKIDNDCNHVVVTLKENYTIEDLKDLTGTISLVAKQDMWRQADQGAPFVAKGDKLQLSFSAEVANEVEDVDGGSKKDDATTIDVANNTIYNMTESGWVEFCGDGNRLSSVLVRLPEGKQVFAYFNEDSIDEIEDKYYDLDADISYINFVAKPNLGQKAEIAIQGDYSDKYYLYEYTGGKLVEIKDADWKEDDGLFEFTASKLGSYVISDKALVAEADEDEADEAVEDTTSKNPDTGANDVVGVAVALAAVSLVAAGAVSLKK